MPEKKDDRLVPRYVQIADHLESQIDDGLLKPSDPLPSYRELAAEYNVSIVTINQVMRQLDTRGRIIRRRGKGIYVAPPTKRNSQTHNLGLIVPDIANPYFASLAKYIQQDFLTHNYAVLTLSSGGDLVNLNRCLRQLINRKVDGLLLIPLDIHRTEQEEALWKLKVNRIPFVYIDDEFSRVPSDYVILDVEQGVRSVAKHLISLGHKRIGCISAQPYIEITSIKIRTFAVYLKEHKVGIEERNIIVSEKRHDEGGFEAGLQLLGQPERPTAVFATNDIIAVGVIRAARKLGLRVPEDVSVAGFDDIQIAQMFDPPITTVSQPAESIAHTATDILLRRIHDELPAEFQKVVFPLNLVVRESTAPPSP